ncbi:hypothetical protein ARMA_2920 [Ardenticatena maritima]|uniref:Uncharacterized protein n=1 Tax=Ardenticatena maritima TaxID=872965 RepID=A0A0M9UDY7_9CHLR|nr:hypothetical protein ARMA_2920 [Ardenticatena maritima]
MGRTLFGEWGILPKPPSAFLHVKPHTAVLSPRCNEAPSCCPGRIVPWGQPT